VIESGLGTVVRDRREVGSVNVVCQTLNIEWVQGNDFRDSKLRNPPSDRVAGQPITGRRTRGCPDYGVRLYTSVFTDLKDVESRIQLLTVEAVAYTSKLPSGPEA
jgi:hypothetical protein